MQIYIFLLFSLYMYNCEILCFGFFLATFSIFSTKLATLNTTNLSKVINQKSSIFYDKVLKISIVKNVSFAQIKLKSTCALLWSKIIQARQILQLFSIELWKASTSGICVSGLDHFDGNMCIVHSHGIDTSSPHSSYIDQVTHGGTRCP